MKATCSICRDVFSLETQVCFVACGHVFHEVCIKRWCATHPTCPQCRHRLKDPPVRMQFEVRSKPEKTLREPECEQLLLDFKALCEEERQLKLKNQDISKKLSALRTQASDAKKKARKREYDVTVWEREYGYAEKGYEMVVNLRKENQSMEKEINFFTRLRKLLVGTKADMNEMLAGIPVTASTIEELWRFDRAMNKQLRSNNEYYKNKITELTNLAEEEEKELKNWETKKANIQLEDKSTQTEDMPVKKIKDRDIDITKPRYDQSTYWGRARHFFETTNPLNLFASQNDLEKSKEIVQLAKAKKWNQLKHLSDDEIWKAKTLYDSAYHPDTGELMFMIGRMSAQVPMNMAITGCMMNFYKSTKAVVFWQWVNQSFNALVNYTNRSGDGELSTDQIMKSYVMATGGALVTALSLNKVAVKFPPLVGRIVPFVAVAAANCINIPMMRLQELEKGIPVSDENGNIYGESKKAAKAAIAAVTFSRVAMASPGMELEKGIPVTGANGEKYGDSKVAARWAIANTVISRNGMCAPGMIITPIAMNSLDRKGFFKRYPWSSTPLSVLICGVALTFATPMCCAIFEQRASIRVEDIEDEIREKIKDDVKVVYYNKGNTLRGGTRLSRLMTKIGSQNTY